MKTETQCEDYLRNVFQENFCDRVKTVNQFYNNIYQSLWNYYTGVVPRQYMGIVPVTEIRDLCLSFIITDRGILNAKVVLPYNKQTIEIGISTTDNVRNCLKDMFGSEFYFGSFKTKESAILNLLTLDQLKNNINGKWDRWITQPLNFIDQAATNPNISEINSKYFKDIYYTAITTQMNLFGVMVLYDINVINKNSTFSNQISKYSLMLDEITNSFKFTLTNRSGRYINTNLPIPVGIQTHKDIINKNFKNLFDNVFTFYADSDAIIPDKTLQAMGNALFPIAKSSAKNFDQITYYQKESTNTTLGEVLSAAKMKKEESKPMEVITPTPEVKQEIIPETPKEDDRYTKNVLALLSGRIADPQIVTSRLNLLHYCYLAIRTLFEVSTEIDFMYNVRVYKRLSRDKFHTLAITVFSNSGILVNFSTKVLLEYGDMPKRKGMVVFISGDKSNCDQKNIVPIIEESNVELFGDTVYNNIISSNWFRSIPALSIEERNNKFKQVLINSGFNKSLTRFLSKNSAHRFTLWPNIRLNGVHVLVDVYLRVDLIQTYLITLSNKGQFVYSTD